MDEAIKARAIAIDNGHRDRLQAIVAQAGEKVREATEFAMRQAKKVEEAYKIKVAALDKQITASANAMKTKQGQEIADLKRQIESARQRHQAELQQVGANRERQMQELRDEKRGALDPIEAGLKAEAGKIDEWKLDQAAIADQTRIEQLGKLNEEKAETPAEPEKKPAKKKKEPKPEQKPEPKPEE